MRLFIKTRLLLSIAQREKYFPMSVILAISTALLGVFVIRLSQLLPSFRRKRNIKIALNGHGGRATVRTLVIWGSGKFVLNGLVFLMISMRYFLSGIGGHTTEMILLLKSFSAEKFSPVHCVLAQVS